MKVILYIIDMAYLGGKSKGSDHIIKILNNSVFDGYDYIEPFCGYCHILRRIKKKKSYIACDSNELLVVLLNNIQKGGKDYVVNKSEYKKLKAEPSINPIKASYAAFTYSYNGKYFGGYVCKYKGRNYPKERKRYYASLYKNETFQKTKIYNRDYKWISNVKDKLIYCDPPYMNTTEYDDKFDSDMFWETVRKASEKNYIFVSEYNAPSDFICIDSKEKRTSISGKGSTRKNKECVFIHKSKINDPLIKEVMRKKSKTRKLKRK